MRPAWCWLLLASGLAAETRVARVVEADGNVEFRLHPTLEWKTASRNTPLVALSEVTTGFQSRVEIEFDDESVLRLSADSAFEISDYLRLSTGQRITHLSIDRGTAYFAGQPEWRDALVLTVSGAKVAPKRGSRARLEVDQTGSTVAVLEGEVRVSNPVIEVDIPAGKTFRIDAVRADRFELIPEVDARDSDTWSRERDRSLPLRFGARILDDHGTWIATSEYGQVWRPKPGEGWAPFRDGKWLWMESFGYTWVGSEPWGWRPYHFGRWVNQPALGWIWVPGGTQTFHGGDVYWMRSAGILAWGPLAPGEVWTAPGVPQQFTVAQSTFAAYTPGAREIDPAGFTARPKDPLTSMVFTENPPWLPPGRRLLEWTRALERPGLIRLTPTPPPAPAEQPTRTREQRAPSPPRSRAPNPPRQPAAPAAPAALEYLPLESFYFAPIYTGIIVMNPQERKPKESKETGEPPRRREPRMRRDIAEILRGEENSRRSR